MYSVVILLLQNLILTRKTQKVSIIQCANIVSGTGGNSSS